jgi:hypothetical protein
MDVDALVLMLIGMAIIWSVLAISIGYAFRSGRNRRKDEARP